MRIDGIKYALSALSGFLVGAALLHSFFWPFVFVGAGGLCIVLRQASSLRQAMGLSFGFGLCKTLVVLIWFWAVYPLDWLGIESVVLQIVLVSMYWFPAAVMFGLGSIFLGITTWFSKKWPWQYQVPVVSIAWVFAEVLGAGIFSLYTLGPGSSLQTSFSFGFSGYALIGQGWFGALAVWGAVYSLSFAVGALSVLCVLLYRISPQFTYGLVSVIALVSFLPTSVSTPSLPEQVFVVGTSWSIADKQKWDISDKTTIVMEILQSAAALKAAYIIFPEDARVTETLGGVESMKVTLTQLFPDGVILIDSARVDIVEGTYLRATIYDSKEARTYTFDKQYLVPQGEYIPYVYSVLIALLPQSTALSNALSDISYRPGVNQADVSLPQHIPAVLFCFESVTPRGVADVTNARTSVPFVAHVVSHGWFHREVSVLVHQLDAMLLTQARYTGYPIVQSGNMVTTKLYQPNGSIIIPEVVAAGETWTLSRF